MSNVIDINSKRTGKEECWFNAFALCLACAHTWIAMVSVETSVFSLECPACKACKSFGAIVPDEYMDAVDKTFAIEDE